jgi:hypothetical protein
MALSTGQVTALCDSVAQGISDFNTSFVTNTSSSATTINNGIGGTGASQTLGRILALDDLTPTLALLTPMNTSAANVAATLTGYRSLTAFYQQFFPFFNALDNNLSGLNAFLATNTLQVNAWLAAAFNNFATNAVALQYRTSSTVPTAIATAQYFPYAAIDTMWGFTSSGATTFSANAVGANVSTAATGGGVGQFYIYKNNSSNAVGSATFTITYTKADGTSTTATYSTTSGVPLASGSLAAGYTISGAIGSAITAVTGTGMTSGEQYTIGMKLVRSAAY